MKVSFYWERKFQFIAVKEGSTEGKNAQSPRKKKRERKHTQSTKPRVPKNKVGVKMHIF